MKPKTITKEEMVRVFRAAKEMMASWEKEIPNYTQEEIDMILALNPHLIDHLRELDARNNATNGI